MAPRVKGTFEKSRIQVNWGMTPGAAANPATQSSANSGRISREASSNSMRQDIAKKRTCRYLMASQDIPVIRQSMLTVWSKYRWHRW